MADSTLAALTALAANDGDELLYVVDDPAGTPLDRKVTTAVLASPLVITDALGAGANDYSPTGYKTGARGPQIIRVANTVSVGLTGLAGGQSGKIVTIKNASSDFLLWLTNQDPASSAANRFRLPKKFPAFLMPGDSITLMYDGTDSLWDVYSWPSQGEAMGLTAFEDFLTPNATTTLGRFPSGLAGSGAAATASTYLVNTTEKPMGAAVLSTGTTTTGRATCGRGDIGTNTIVPAQGCALSVARLARETAADGTDTYTIITGFFDSVTAGATDGVGWEYRWDGVSAEEWSQTRTAASSPTRSNTGSPAPDANYVWLVVFLNAAWSRVDFIYSTDSITFTKSASPTTGLPSSAQLVGWATAINKSAGTNSRNCHIDFAGYRVDYARG